MITRTIARVFLSVVLLGWLAARFVPVATTNRSLAIEAGTLLIIIGATVVSLRLLAGRWLDAQFARIQGVFGYAAPRWVHDASGLILMLAGLCLVAWWAT